MLDQSLRHDPRHSLIGIMDAPASSVAKGERERLLDIIEVSGPYSFILGHPQTIPKP